MKACSQCGSMQDDDAVFCNKCGSSFNNAVIPPQQPMYQQPQPQFQPQLAAQGVQGGVTAANGSKKKLIIIISAVTAVIGITLLILFLFVFKPKNYKIVGTWKTGNDYSTFSSDGTLELGAGRKTGTYSVKGDMLYVTYKDKTIDYEILSLTENSMTLREKISQKSFVFTKVTDENEIKQAAEKQKIKAANENAKLAYVTISNKLSELAAEGERTSIVRTNGAVSVSSLKDSTEPVKRAVYEALADNGGENGYICIDFNSNGSDPELSSYLSFVQWSEKAEGAVIGQYPSPTKDASDQPVFGTFNT